MPAILIGLGGYGAAVLSEFRHQLTDRYGPMEHLPATKMIWIDTDAGAVDRWTAPGHVRGLSPDDAIVAPLNRPSHYLKPRRAGRSLIDGWFDPQMLYRTQRNPTTQGIRALGRLAWCDHYRAISRKIREHLEAVVQPDALSQTQRQTGQTLRTNRPRVYIIADLGGGTGGGTFIDAAYTVRHKMMHLGYGDPQIVGIFHLPSADRTSLQSGRLVNCYASLRELNHFSNAETQYHGSFEDERGDIRDPNAPFSRFYLFSRADGAVAGFTRSQPTEASKTAETPANVAEFLRRDLFTMLGRTVDEDRGSISGPETNELRGLAIGQAGFVWPRQEILSRGASWLFETILGRWLMSDPGQIRGPVRQWLNERWAEESLSPESLISKLQAECEKNLGESPEAFFASESQQYVPRGWFARLPDSARVWQTMLKFQDLVGMPDEHCVQRPVGHFEQVLQTAADNLIRSALPRVRTLAMMLVEHPDYRVAGAEEFIEQTGSMLDSMLQHYQPLFQDLSRKAAEAYYRIQNHSATDHGGIRLTPAEVGDQVRAFPRFRYQHLVLRQLCRIYSEIRIRLGDQTREIRFCRQRLEEIARRVHDGQRGSTLDPDLLLLAPGCYSMEEALESLRGTITGADVQNLDGAIGDVLKKEFGSLFQVCMNPAQSSLLESAILGEIRRFLGHKLGNANLRAMFESRFPTMEHAVAAIRGVYEMARPPMLPPNSRPDQELAVLSIPDGAESEVFCQIARKSLPHVDMIPAHSTDEIMICRESSRVVLTDLPQLGTIAEDAYRVLVANPQSSPHARVDITEWLDIEVESH